MIATATALLQYAAIVAFVLTIAASVAAVKHRPRARALCLPPVIWAAAGLAFYALWFAGGMSSAAFILLSAAHRTMGATLILAMVLVSLGEVDDQ